MHTAVPHLHWRMRLALILLVMALLPFARSMPTTAAPKAQAELFAGSSGSLRVIVQKTVDDGSVEQLVTELGGAITNDLHIINAFAAEIPAAAIRTLAVAPPVSAGSRSTLRRVRVVVPTAR